MKLIINPDLTVTPVITQISVCPLGTAYYRIDYQIDGMTIYSVNTKAIFGSPSPLDVLDWIKELLVPCDETDEGARRYARGGHKTGYKRSISKTNREWLEAAADSFVID